MYGYADAPDLAMRLVDASFGGRPAFWPPGAAEALAEEVFEAATDHGVGALLARSVSGVGGRHWPAGLRDRLGRHLTGAAATEVLRRAEIERVLRALDQRGVRALLMKGTPLAYTHYAKPWLRPRADTDLLIAADHQSDAAAVLTNAAYVRATGYSGTLVTHQHEWSRVDQYGLTHVFDIHTRVANPEPFAGALDYADQCPRAVPVPTLGPAARSLCSVDALLLAGVHRAAHHLGSNRRVWLYDIQLLVGRMTGAQLAELVDQASAKGLRAVTFDAISAACRQCGTPIPQAVVRLGRSASRRTERTALFLRPDVAKIDILCADLGALPDWRARVRLIREHLFPPVAYIRHAYAVSHPAMVPLAYTHRILSGAAGWFRRP